MGLTHSSLPRDLRTLGFGPDEIRKLASDGDYRMPIAALEAAIAEDKAAGRRPLIAVGSAGTTNAGTVDPLSRMADICRAERMWFHVDGAFGAPAAVTEQGRKYLAGMERADSVVLDPHKWFFQPYDVGATLVTPRAGEIVGELVLAIKVRTPLHTLADVIHPFPAFNRVLGAAIEELAATTSGAGGTS